MAVFLSTYVNKIDRKGRISVPAAFRAALAPTGSKGIVAYRAVKLTAIEVSGLDRAENLSRRIDRLPELSDERDALSAILGELRPLDFDGEGRIVLPADLARHADLSGTAVFVGCGPTFQIWEPERFRRHQEEMRARIRERGLTLPPDETQ
ncbi:MAG: division/cell wall cluster transcriptional repressor MraZ [Stellaceae bacterium]